MDRYVRTIVEQDDELFTDMNEFELFVRDAAQVEFCALVVTKFEGNGLVGRGFDDFDDPWGRAGPCPRGRACLCDTRIHYWSSLMTKAVPAWL